MNAIFHFSFIKLNLRRAFTTALFSILAFAFGTAQTFAAGGDADPTFKVGVTGYSTDSKVETIAVQADGRILIGGGFTVVNGIKRNYIARLNTDGSLDTSFNSNVNSLVYAIAPQTDGRILIGGQFTQISGVSRQYFARLNADGSLDTSFGAVSAINGTVYAIREQPDGKILVGGGFAKQIARISSDGTIDSDFMTNIGTGTGRFIYAIDLQTDGKIIFGGDFTTFNGAVANRIGRLNADGTFDSSFNTGAGANSTVRNLNVLSDDKIVVAGSFSAFAGASLGGLVKLNADGTMDSNFNTATRPGTQIFDMKLQPDGKILVGGSLSTANNQLSRTVNRMNADGSLDTTFDFRITFNSFESLGISPAGDIYIGGGFEEIGTNKRTALASVSTDGAVKNDFAPLIGRSDSVYALALQPDGKIVVGGRFAGVNEKQGYHLARLNEDGTIDQNFNIGTGFNGFVTAVAVQTDGKILVGGIFTTLNGVRRDRLVRLNADGSPDTTFNATANGEAYEIQQLADGKILVAGNITSINGISRKNIFRLNADGSVDESFVSADINSAIKSFFVQTDGRILIGGNFTLINNLSRKYLARLNADGSLDTDFDTSTGFDGVVEKVTIDANGKVLAGGSFFTYRGASVNRVVRLNQDLTLDNTFGNATGANGTVYEIAHQTDGKIIIGGGFTFYKGVAINRLARLNADGSLDASFRVGTGADNNVRALLIQADGRIVAGGDFSLYNGNPANGLLRVLAGSTTRWTGATDTNWNNPANWSDNVVPTASDNVIISANAGNSPILGSGNFALTNLTLEAGASLNVSSGASLEVQGLINDGNLSGGGTLVLKGSSASNNGTISVSDVRAAGSGIKSLSGAGVFEDNILTIESGTTLRLDGDQTFEKVLAQGNGYFNITSRTVRLRGAGQALSGNVDSTLSTVIYEGDAPQMMSGNFHNLLINNAAGVSLSNTVFLGGTLNLQNGAVETGSNSVQLSGAANVVRGAVYVIGNLRKTFSQNGSFTFPLGTANGYSPVTINVTSGTPTISASVFQTAHPSLPAESSLRRFWRLETSTGATFTADLTFQYTDADVAGNEANYKVTKISGGAPQQFANDCPSTCVDAAANTATVSNVSSFSDWTLSESFAPTAVSAALRGRIFTGSQPLAGVLLRAFDPQTNQIRTAISGADGSYEFSELAASSTYIINAERAGFRFEPPTRVVNFSEELGGVDFQAVRRASFLKADDFDGDGRADVSVFRPEEGAWYIWQSATNDLRVEYWGLASDELVPADYDGDGKTDLAVFREGSWFIKSSRENGKMIAHQFGQAGDVPLPADLDADGEADLTVFREGFWYSLLSSNNEFRAVQWGLPTDKPLVGDFDGDSKGDLTVFRAGVWYILQSSDGKMRAAHWGLPTDIPLSADFTGDGKTDVAVFRPSEGTWYVLRGDGTFDAVKFGLESDKLVPGDFDGDGIADPAVFRNGIWHISGTNSGYSAAEFGFASDKPISGIR